MTSLREAFVAAFPTRVRARCVELGVAVPEEAISAGVEWLDQALATLLALPFEQQKRGPLELFQEAMRFPTEALAADGLSPVDRSLVAVAALPGDVYDLAPASSQDLGESAWVAHLRWGAAKAAAMTKASGPVPDSQ